MNDAERQELRGWAPYRERLRWWRQTPALRVPDADGAVGLIEDVGLATVYPASPEVASLFHAHVGDPDANTDSKWDSPAGFVYGWRWALGRRKAAFYGILVRKRPTFVKWSLLPSILRLVGDLRTPDELYDFGVISSDAYRIAQVLEGADAPVSTPELRAAAGFPNGKEQSSAYHKALSELDARLLITNEFMEDAEGNKHHGLMFVRHPEHVQAAERMTVVGAFDTFLRVYLPAAVYVAPRALSRHLRVAEDGLRTALEELCQSGHATAIDVPGAKGSCYVWTNSTITRKPADDKKE